MRNFFRVWKERRDTRNALFAMTDKELNDIGICRGDIRRIVSEIN